MSCDYDIKCRTCNVHHGFSDANHQDKLMHHLIKHAKVIGKLYEVQRTLQYPELRLEFSSYGSCNLEWFATHCKHDLVVIDEYGYIQELLENRCSQYDSRCTLPGKMGQPAFLKEGCLTSSVS